MMLNTKKRKKSYLSKKRKVSRKKKTVKRITHGGSNVQSIPVFIISYNQYTYLKSMIEQLSQFPGMTLYVIDNKSTYPPLIEYLKKIEDTVKVLYQPENYGHKVYMRDEIIALGGDKYVVTDPDLLLNPNLPQNFIQILSDISDKYKGNKVGFALDIKNNINTDRKIKVKKTNNEIFGAKDWKGHEGKTISEVESVFWNDKIDDPYYELYRASVDTTFCLINKQYYAKNSLENCIRVAGDFTAVHRPWLHDYKNDLEPGEYEYYLGEGNKSSSIKLYKNQKSKGGNREDIKVGVLAQFKNEEMTLKEWIEHYIWQGIDVIVLLNNNSTDNFNGIIDQFKNHVYLLDAPKKNAQKENYREIGIPELKRHNVNVVGILDIDEYMFGTDGKTLKEHVVEVFKNPEDRPSQFSCFWNMFGSSGYNTQPKSIRESFLYREEGLHQLYKSFAWLDDITDIDIHSSIVSGKTIQCPAGLQLNHYPIMSKEYFEKVKMTRGDGVYKHLNNIRNWEYFKSYDENANALNTKLANIVKATK